jgi:hypothetical protein
MKMRPSRETNDSTLSGTYGLQMEMREDCCRRLIEAMDLKSQCLEWVMQSFVARSIDELMVQTQFCCC